MAAALAASRAGWDVRMYERVAAFSEVGAGVQLGPNVVRCLQAWGLQKALQQVAAWARQGRWPGDWKLALNQSASDLQQPHWFDQLRQLLAQLALNPAWLELELAEPA